MQPRHCYSSLGLPGAFSAVIAICMLHFCSALATAGGHFNAASQPFWILLFVHVVFRESGFDVLGSVRVGIDDGKAFRITLYEKIA